MIVFTNGFHWGICIIADSELVDVPTLSGDAAKTSTAIVIPVHDPTSNDGDVTVRVHEEPAHRGVRVEGVIAVPSKKLVVGDSNDKRLFEIPTGHCQVQVAAMPWGAARQIDIWIVPVERPT